MFIKAADPDLESIARRLLDDEIDLQPEFQRQEVWSRVKKQKLIDTILREWAVPPIHIIQTPVSEEVLDGQQRLTTIRDFYSNKFSVSGKIHPLDPQLQALDGLYYYNLPERVRKKIDRYTLRIYSVNQASPEEASELFYRLNQPTALTAGEQRNALYGVRRTQMKNIVERMLHSGYSSTTIGFSNSRLAYDDVIARILSVLEEGTLRLKITEGWISDSFRKQEPFSETVTDTVINAIQVVGSIARGNPLRFNKASLFSFIVFLCRKKIFDRDIISDTAFYMFTTERHFDERKSAISFYRAIFNDRAASRVTDISSVVVRDFAVSRVMFEADFDCVYSDVEMSVLHEAILCEQSANDEQFVDKITFLVMRSKWGIAI